MVPGGVRGHGRPPCTPVPCSELGPGRYPGGVGVRTAEVLAVAAEGLAPHNLVAGTAAPGRSRCVGSSRRGLAPTPNAHASTPQRCATCCWIQARARSVTCAGSPTTQFWSKRRDRGRATKLRRSGVGTAAAAAAGVGPPPGVDTGRAAQEARGPAHAADAHRPGLGRALREPDVVTAPHGRVTVDTRGEEEEERARGAVVGLPRAPGTRPALAPGVRQGVRAGATAVVRATRDKRNGRPPPTTAARTRTRVLSTPGQLP